MIWYIIGAFILILFIFLKLKKAGGQPILSASITTNDGLDFDVKFKQLHPEVKPIEYLRLILNFITKLYYISDESKEDNRSQIRYFLQIMSESTNLQNGLAKFEGQVTLVEGIHRTKESKEIVATLLYKDILTRNLVTKVPLTWYPNQFYYSILALTFSCMNYLDDYQKELLHKALKNLTKEYYSSHDTKSLQASYILPNKAFVEATYTK
jgi:hypothetical protein